MEEVGNEVDENEFHTLSYELRGAYLDHGALLASSYLRMPSGSKTYDNVKWSCPKVVMDLKNRDENHCLQLMMTCAHENILHAKIVTAEGSCNVVWTEPFTGLLITLLEQMKSNLGDYSTGMVPSSHLRIIVSQWFDGIGHLRHCGKYHGDFRLENTYYDDSSGDPVIKLTNFRVKDGKLMDCQLEDVRAIACGLDEICNMAEQWNREIRHPTWDCCLVIDLAKKLREVSKEDLVSVMEDIRKKHMFFWDKEDRTRFYIHDLLPALKSPDFIKDVEASNVCTIPWDADQYAGLLRDMNQYRVLHHQTAYDGTKKIQFCAFCSGLYTHKSELPCVKCGLHDFDNVLQRRNPKACFEMVCMMPDREKKIHVIEKRSQVLKK